jgi:hypothetical protein
MTLDGRIVQTSYLPCQITSHPSPDVGRLQGYPPGLALSVWVRAGRTVGVRQM